MKRTTAEQISKLLLEISKQLDGSIKLIMENSDQKEFEKYRQTVGKIMGVMFMDILTPLYQEHPDLTPENLKNKKL